MSCTHSWWCPDERFPRGFHRASRFFAHRSTTHARGRFVSETRAMKADLSTPKIDRGLDDIYVKETSICFIDGQRGRLVYRGYDIRELAEYSTFEETVFLLLQGHLPNSAELVKAKADLGLNASTFGATVAASTVADLYSTVVGAIATLKGPLHGGAIEAALNMIETIGKPDLAENFVLNTLRNKEKVYGFGHRVYKTYDPRALIMKDYARKLAQMQGDDTYFRIAATIEDTVVRELASKRVFPNVDFYSGLVFHGLGIPTDLFTPVFALSRISGWTAHVIEYWEDNRLLRPLDWYVGPRDLAYVPLDERA